MGSSFASGYGGLGNTGGNGMFGSNSKRQKSQHTNYEQATYVVTDDDLGKTGGKEKLFEKLNKRGEVAFPERKSKKTIPKADDSFVNSKYEGLSRIEQLRFGHST
mmetsp:Transcript_8773/g.14886  ORF Transcript_8773/g.14886 Transcript_8773/m.14886 type:complete len:105 (+) Transcript_8773:62-376(+)